MPSEAEQQGDKHGATLTGCGVTLRYLPATGAASKHSSAQTPSSGGRGAICSLTLKTAALEPQPRAGITCEGVKGCKIT